VPKVDAEAFTSSANVAKRTMINVFVGIVVVKVTNFAEIFGKRLVTKFALGIPALLPGWLESTAWHAQHLSHVVSVEI
jgi:hypothetical protein